MNSQLQTGLQVGWPGFPHSIKVNHKLVNSKDSEINVSRFGISYTNSLYLVY